LQLMWVKSNNNRWLRLSGLDFERIQTTGVYILWHGGQQPAVISVGAGDIGTHLRDHFNNINIRRYENNGELMVTWAAINSLAQRDGVESYLVSLCRPLISNYRFSSPPTIAPLAVKSPFI